MPYGHFDSVENVLSIQATNLKKFESLIEQAQKQADELQKTINRLASFDFKFKFFDGKNET